VEVAEAEIAEEEVEVEAKAVEGTTCWYRRYF
jgi:hypothetical protein